MSTTTAPTKGLEGIVAATSGICWIDGEAGVLSYRGIDIHELAAHSTFEETCYLLWNGHLPTRAELGTLKKELAEGRSIILCDGKTVAPEDVLGQPEGAKKLVIIGDTETTDGLGEQVRRADLLVIEATFLQRDSAMAREYGHLTAMEAASLAAPSTARVA